MIFYLTDGKMMIFKYEKSIISGIHQMYVFLNLLRLSDQGMENGLV